MYFGRQHTARLSLYLKRIGWAWLAKALPQPGCRAGPYASEGCATYHKAVPCFQKQVLGAAFIQVSIMAVWQLS